MTRKNKNKQSATTHSQGTQPASALVSVSHSEQKIESTVATTTGSKTTYEWVVFFCKHWWGLVIMVLTTVFNNIVTQIQGNPDHFWSFLLKYPLLTIGTVAITAIAPMIILRHHNELAPDKAGHKKPAGTTDSVEHITRKALANTIIPIVIPAITTTLFIALLGLVVFRPPWCPGAICPPIQTRVATNPTGAHDSNLDAYFTAFQSNSYVIPADPSSYGLQVLPRSIGAVRSDLPRSQQTQPYRVALEVHDLQQSGYEIDIEHVILLVKQVPPLATPLNVWTAGSLDYNSSPYSVTYSGEGPGTMLPADYEPFPGVTNAHQSLQPGEADAIDIQINPTANLQADLQFQVQIVYRLANESQEHSLTLPNTFEVVFSNVSNWHPFHFQNGHFSPA